MTAPAERHLAVVESAEDLHGRINMALSLVQHRHFCPDCTAIADLVRMALTGASIDQLLEGTTRDGGK